MKIICKTIFIMLISLGTLLMADLFQESLMGMVLGEFPNIYDIKDWWYEQVNYHLLHYMIATSVLSGFLFLSCKIIDYYSTNKIRIVLGVIFGCLFMLILNIFYWEYIKSNCYGVEFSTLEQAFMISYGSHEHMRFFWIVYTCLILSLRLIIRNMEYLISNLRERIVWHQIFLSEDVFDKYLYIGMPWIVFVSGNYLTVGFFGIEVIPIFVFVILVKSAVHFGVRISKFITVDKYYRGIEEDPEKKKHSVIFEESPFINKSFIDRQLFGNGIFWKEKVDKVWFYPSVLCKRGEQFIKLDIYDEWMFARTKSKKAVIVNYMTQQRGIFNLAYNLGKEEEYIKRYDFVYESKEELLKAIRKLDGYTNFKECINKQLKQIDLSKLTKETNIISEIIEFRRFLMNQIDEFIVFDYLIKWFENVNYLFALIAISRNKVKVSPTIKMELENADFRKWRELFEKLLDKDKEFKTRLNSFDKKEQIFDRFNRVYQIITLREYKFKNYSIKELLDAANKLRDYTRGHGVFTFEISQEMNLNLTEILVFLINCLIDCQMLEENLENLEELGWVIYSGDIPYYLYSVDNKYKEFRYESFQEGNSIALPLDIYRPRYE